MKLSKRTLWLWKRPPGKADPPPEASFASSPERAARSVNSHDRGRVIELRKSQSSGVLAVAIDGDHTRTLHWIWRWGPAGVREHGKGQKGSQGTWENRRRPWGQNTGKQRVRPVEQHPGTGAAISPRRRANQRNQPEVWRRNATNGATPDKPGSLSRLISTDRKQANESRRSLGVGKGAVGLWNRS